MSYIQICFFNIFHTRLFLVCVTDASVETRLRDLGFGYRARFLQQSAQLIVNSHGPDWLQSLRSAPYLQARDALRALPGVGLKVSVHSFGTLAETYPTHVCEHFRYIFHICLVDIIFCLVFRWPTVCV